MEYATSVQRSLQRGNKLQTGLCSISLVSCRNYRVEEEDTVATTKLRDVLRDAGEVVVVDTMSLHLNSW